MKFDLPQNIKFVLDTLISNGHKAYIVGGCVRDLLCGKTPCDYDITTSAKPNEIQNLFEKTIKTGIKHGTITVIAGGENIEVTTFRNDGTYTDSRHPNSVNFVSDVTEDLARRDFTVNAMCYNEYDGLIDCFGGKADINNRILRAVGDAKTRFSEDALRILRLFRFSATLELGIEQVTFDAAIECAHLLKNISAERIFSELKKSSMGTNVTALYPLLDCGSLKKYCLIAADLSKISKLEKNEKLRLFSLINLTSTNIGKTLNQLKCSNKFKTYCEKMHFLCENIINENKVSIKNALNFADAHIVRDVLIYYRDIIGIDTAKLKALLDEIISTPEPYLISHLNISGEDIKALGINGKDVGKTLEFLLNKVIENPSLNKREKLIKFICN